MSDSETVKTWLSRALAAGADFGKTKSGLADFCEVRKQAVDGWLRTGRITKSNLARAATYFGHAPAFDGAASVVREPAPSTWPLQLVRLDELMRLPKRRLARIDRMIRELLDGWAEDDAAGKRKAA